MFDTKLFVKDSNCSKQLSREYTVSTTYKFSITAHKIYSAVNTSDLAEA